jgi:polysaccharide pyruvyl transferase WcaK-like protein
MQTNSDRIALLQHVGGGNLGDDATLDTVRQQIQRRWPNAYIAALTVNPSDTIKRHKLPSYPLRTAPWSFGPGGDGGGRSWRKSLSSLKRKHPTLLFLPRLAYKLAYRLPKALGAEIRLLFVSKRLLSSFKFLVVCGGGQLTGKDGPWSFPYTLFKWVVLAKTAGVKCLFLNVGAGPLAHPLSRFFVLRALECADYVSFRDESSKQLVSQIGFKGNGSVYPDCAYIRIVSDREREPSRVASSPTVGIAPMPYWGPHGNRAKRDQRCYQRLIDNLAMFAIELEKRSYSVQLFGTDIGFDPLAIAEVQRTIERREDALRPQYRPVESLEQLFATMATFDYIVTCRFHGVVFAHLLNKPVLAIAHHPKVATLMHELDLSMYCLEMETLTPTLLVNKFMSLAAETDRIKRNMATRLAKYQSLLTAQFDELFAFQAC